MSDKVLILEGMRGGVSNMGRTCRRFKTVHSKALGRRVRKCADFSGFDDAGDMGAITDAIAIPSMEEMTNLAIMGASGAGGLMGLRFLLANIPFVKDMGVRAKGLVELVLALVVGRAVGGVADSMAVEMGIQVAGGADAVSKILLGTGAFTGLGLIAEEISEERRYLPGRRGFGVVTEEPDEFAIGYTPAGGYSYY